MRSWPSPRGCRAGWRCITRATRGSNPDIFYHSLSERPAARDRGLFGFEHERGGVAGRLEGGDDFEQERQPERLGVQRRRLQFETPDDGRGRFVAVLVAGRAMDLFRDQNRTSAAAGQSFRRRRRGSKRSTPPARRIRRSRTGRRTANGSRSRRRRATLTSA
jgi:hypothetical protein